MEHVLDCNNILLVLMINIARYEIKQLEHIYNNYNVFLFLLAAPKKNCIYL